MTGEPGSPLRLLADEFKELIRLYALDDYEVEHALALVVADEIGKTALRGAALGRAAPSRDAVKRHIAVLALRFAEAVVTHAYWALPDAEETEPALTLDHVEAQEDGRDHGR